MKKKQAKFKILVADPLEEVGLQILKKEKECRTDLRPNLTPQSLKQIIGDYDAIIIRSSTQITKEILENAGQLKVIARAGVGVDNIDTGAATKKGIIVMNTPEGNTTSAAEHTMSLLLALARQIPQADVLTKRREWRRTGLVGTELYRKILGLIGLGRIGKEVARRAMAFGMRVIAYDPYITSDAVKQLGVELFKDVKTVLKQADFLSVHTPLTDDTYHVIDHEQFKLMKPGVRIINCARGGIINEKALYQAIKSGRVKGAALDVFEHEPPGKNPLLGMKEVIVTPHLGAFTEEAQENVARDAAQQVIDALLNRGIRNAVNLPSLDGETMQILGPWLNLAERIGLLHMQLFGGSVKELHVKYSGEVTGFPLAPLTLACLKGLLTPILGSGVNFVNAPTMAKERGLIVNESKTSQVEDFVNAIAVEVRSSQATNSVIGTLFGNKDPRIVRINEFHVDAVPRGYMLFITNVDKPGVVGELGTLLGENNINIAEMTLGRKKEGAYAITVINTDNQIPPNVLGEIKSLKNIIDAKIIKL